MIISSHNGRQKLSQEKSKKYSRDIKTLYKQRRYHQLVLSGVVEVVEKFFISVEYIATKCIEDLMWRSTILCKKNSVQIATIL